MKHLHVAVAGTMWAFLLAGGIVTASSWAGGPQHAYFDQDFANQAAALTGAKVKFQVLPAGPIGSPCKVYETVQKSVTQAGHSWLGYDRASVALWLPNCIMVKG